MRLRLTYRLLASCGFACAITGLGHMHIVCSAAAFLQLPAVPLAHVSASMLWCIAGALTHLGVNCTVEADAKALPSCECCAGQGFRLPGTRACVVDWAVVGASIEG